MIVLTAGAVALALSPPLRVHGVRVEGAVAADPGEIASLAAAQGRPLALVDASAVAERVKSSPLVLDARVRTDYLRRTVVIDVVERAPVAFALSGAGYLLVDSDGVGLAITDSAPLSFHYLTGEIAPKGIGDRSERASWAAQSALEISRWSKSGVQAAGYGERGVFLVTSDGVMVYLGSVDRIQEKGRALRAVQAKAEAERWNLRYVDVTTPENPAVSK